MSIRIRTGYLTRALSSFSFAVAVIGVITSAFYNTIAFIDNLLPVFFGTASCRNIAMEKENVLHGSSIYYFGADSFGVGLFH